MAGNKLTGMAREVAEKYRETLVTLTFNDKIRINTLTEIAKEDQKYANVIVDCIEARLRKVPADQMLPLMYLIDSICKNHGSPYKEMFNHNLVSNFAYIFQQVSEKDFKASSPKELAKAAQVRSNLYKLRITWGGNFQIFTPAVLHQLDLRIKKIDPAWPVIHPKPVASAPTVPNGASNTKIHVNPNFVSKTAKAKTPPVVDETEKMREELLRAEAELIQLKKMQVEQQILEAKKSLQKPVTDGSTISSTTPGLTPERKTSSSTSPSSASLSSQSEKTTKKVESKSRDPRKNSRDPRKRDEKEEKKDKSPSRHKSGSKSPKEKTSESSKSKSSSSSSSSKHESKSHKSSSSSSSTSKSSSSSSKTASSSSKSSDSSRKRKSPDSAEVSLSPSPVREEEGPGNGRISPLPPPPDGRIPKVRKTEGGTFEEALGASEKPPRGGKRPSGGKGSGGNHPDKKSRTQGLFVETELVPDDSSREAPSPQVGWGEYKEENPDQFRTPVKEEAPWNWEERQEEDPRGFRGGRNFRGNRNRRPDNRDPRWGNRGGPGDWRGRGRGGALPPFGRGGALRPPVPPAPFAPGVMFPNMAGIPTDLTATDPEVIRKEVIPRLIRMGEQGRNQGTISEPQFREFMQQIMILKESSLIREAENKENRRLHGLHHQQGKFPPQGLLGPPPDMEVDGKPPSLLAMPPLERPLDNGPPVPPTSTRSPHKNDLPMADPVLLQEIENDPTKTLNIDDIPRTIRYYGETATIVLEDNKICELSFQKEHEARRIVVDDTVTTFHQVGSNSNSELVLDGVSHRIKIGSPTRELWVDGVWHEAFFNTLVRIRIGARERNVFIDGGPPTVKIGEVRPDLCLGRVFALLDGNVMDKVALFLDRKPQHLEIAGKAHLLQFVEDFRTLTINGHPFRADFGGFPMVISVGGKKHYLRLTSLPMGTVLPSPGSLQVPRPITPTNLGDRSRSSLSPGDHNSSGGKHSPHSRRPSNNSSMPRTPPPMEPRSPPSPPRMEDSTSQDGVGLHGQDPLNTVMGLFPTRQPETNIVTSPGYPSVEGTNGPAPPSFPPAPPPVADVNDLFAQLLKSGIIQGAGAGGGYSGGGIPGLETLAAPEEKAPSTAPHSSVQEELLKLAGQDGGQKSRGSLSNGTIKPIVLQSLPGGGVHPSLKERQQGLIDLLYASADLQCKTCGQRYSREEMSQYTAHLDWHFRVKRREKDNARKAQSRKWFFEKRDWIVSDEVEDETEEMTEEELVAEEEMVIPTVAVEADKKENTVCPVCREEFATFYKQGEGEGDEGGWYYHNAIRTEEGLFHPECHKDKDNGMDASNVDTSMEENSSPVKKEMEVEEEKEDVHKASNDETTNELASPAPTEESVIKTEPPAEQTNDDLDVPMEEVSAQDNEASVAVKEEHEKEETDANDNNLDSKENVAIKEEEEVTKSDEVMETETNAEEQSEELVDSEEVLKHSDSLLEETEKEPLAVPVVPAKVNISMKLTSSVPVERRESVLSQPSDSEEAGSEFDPDAVIVAPKSKEELDAAKPRLKGKKFTVMPPMNKDSDLSGLCSIM